MKRNLAVASMFILAALSPSAGFAGDPVPGVNVGAGKNPGAAIAMWVETCKDGGGIAIPAGGGLSYCASASALGTCKEKGGAVAFHGGKAGCNLPK